MHAVRAFVPCDAQTCWRAFTAVSTLVDWVPGLLRAQTIAMSRGLPGEVHFEHVGGFAYTLVYSYDIGAREVRWEPKLGPREGVSGFARFDAVADGTEVTYGLEPGAARGEADVQRIVDAFVHWVMARS